MSIAKLQNCYLIEYNLTYLTPDMKLINLETGLTDHHTLYGLKTYYKVAQETANKLNSSSTASMFCSLNRCGSIGAGRGEILSFTKNLLLVSRSHRLFQTLGCYFRISLLREKKPKEMLNIPIIVWKWTDFSRVVPYGWIRA